MIDPESSFPLFVVIGFIAQIIDGALGMAYGTLSTTILMAVGLPPATVSVSVHTAQFFTTGLSGFFNAFFKNVNWRLCAMLSAAGIAGGVTGALFLTNASGKSLKPWIAGYLFLLGLTIIKKALGKKKNDKNKKEHSRLFIGTLGTIAGFLDAVGGGGWGPIVTSHLIAGKETPRYVIGSGNVAEFFVKTSIAATLISAMGIHFGTIIMGLLTGGVLAAPLGAYVLRHIKPEKLMLFVGLLITGLSLWQIEQVLF